MSHAPLHAFMHRVAAEARGEELVSHLEHTRRRLAAATNVRAARFAILEALLRTLDELLSFQPRKADGAPLERTLGQIAFHNAVVAALAEGVFGRELLAEVRDELEFRYGFTDFTPIVAILAPRRFGKTWGIAELACACLLSIPHYIVVIASLGSRVSTELMDTMKSFLANVPGFEEQTDRNNANFLTVTNPADARDVRKVRWVPGEPDRCRGLKFRMLIMDEADFMNEDFFFNYALAAMQEEGTTVVLVTTPNGRSGGAIGYVQAIMLLRDKYGKPVVHTVHIGGKCEECTIAGVGRCPHAGLYLPTHMTSARREMVMALMSTSSKANALIQQELMAEYASAGGGFLPPEGIDAIEKGVAWRPAFEYHVARVFICVDPNEGGRSNTSFVAVFYLPGAERFVVCGLAAEAGLAAPEPRLRREAADDEPLRAG
ncbi:MAG: hypothetical protein WCN81_13050, partial [Actinomycetes bacterium]